jgi:hypothetical protein
VNAPGVPSRRNQLAEARRLGCDVAPGNGGEVRVTLPDGTRLNLNNRRKDGTPELAKALRSLREESEKVDGWAEKDTEG